MPQIHNKHGFSTHPNPKVKQGKNPKQTEI